MTRSRGTLSSVSPRLRWFILAAFLMFVARFNLATGTFNNFFIITRDSTTKVCTIYLCESKGSEVSDDSVERHGILLLGDKYYSSIKL